MKLHLIISQKNRVFALFFIVSHFFFNNSFAQSDTCQTASPSTDYLENIGIHNYVQNYTPKTFSIYLHIIRNITGHGGITNQQINNWLNVLRNDFSNAEIFFEEVGRNVIKSDTYYYYSNNQFNNLIQEGAHSNAIDIYFLSNATNDAFMAARAEWIPSTALVIGMKYIGTHILSHEIGHCLGLYHTHEWRFGKDFDGSDCESKGDKVCDTWPDANLSPTYGVEIENCVINPSSYPDPPWMCCPPVENIMSYAPPECMEWFTYGQYDRMHTIIENSSELQNAYFQIASPNNLTWSDISNYPNLTWNVVNDPNLVGYNVYRNLSDCGPDYGSYALIAIVDASTTNYHDTSIEIGHPKFAQFDAYYYVTALNNGNYESFPSNIIDVPTDIMYKGSAVLNNNLLTEYKLLGNYPNPFNPSTKIRFSLEYDATVSLKIYNSLGILLSDYKMKDFAAGVHEINFNASKLSSGIYFYELTANEFKAIGKMIYLK